MARNDKPIMAYGNDDDRARMARIAKEAGCSQSAWLLRQIRQTHNELFGTDNPYESPASS